MFRYSFSFSVICALSALISLPAAHAADSPTTRPVRSVADVESTYHNRVTAIERQYRSALNDAASSRLDGLHVLEDRALASQDIDTAEALRTKIAAGESGESESKRISAADRKEEMNWLEHQLDDTLWHWGEDFVKFRSDGELSCASWSDRGIVTHWKVIDTRTVLLTIVKGRNFNLIAYMTFNAKADAYTATDFQNDSKGAMLHTPQTKVVATDNP